jgi:DNA repair photolyase
MPKSKNIKQEKNLNCKCGKPATNYINGTKGLCEEHYEEYKKKYSSYINQSEIKNKFISEEGKEVAYTSALDVNNQIFFCGVPFRLDTYSGCTHGCSYCFVRSAELTSASRNNKGNYVVPGDFEAIRRTFYTALDTDQDRENISIEWIRHRVPLHWGGMSDPFQPAEGKFGISKKVLEVLNNYNYPTVISSKGILSATPEYMELLKKGNYAYQVSLISDNEEFMKKIEPGTPSPKERMKLLEKFANNGIWTAVRIQPVIPNSVVERELPTFIKHLSEIGVKHIVTEGYKLPLKAENELKYVWSVCPDTAKVYQYADTKTEGFEAHMSSWRKWQYVKVAKELCASYNISYGCGDNDMRDMGDCVCCCGIDKLPGFENFWRYQAGQAAEIAKHQKYVSIEDMQQFWHGEKTFPIHNTEMRERYAKEFGKVASTPKFAIDWYWNAGGEMSPESIFSMRKTQVDGKLVYERIDPIPLLESKHTEQGSMF